MKTAVVGYPRIGALRELKFALEKYFRYEISEEELEATAKALRILHQMIFHIMILYLTQHFFLI